MLSAAKTVHARYMADFLRSRPVLPLLALTLVAVPACYGFGPINGVEGSGVPETTTIDTAEFDGIQVTGIFEVALTIKEGPPSVVVTVDDNLVDDLDLQVIGDRLRVGFERGSYEPNVRPTAVITVAGLNDIEVSGASLLTATGLTGGHLTIDVSGASNFVGTGHVTTISVGASGASHVNLSELTTSGAEVNASGASSIELGGADTVSGELSGASHLSAPAGAAGSIETTGASGIERK